jgi:hypothetical protein
MPIGSEIITGVLSSIVYDSLKRPCKGLIDAFSRRRDINRALSHGTQSETVDGSDVKPAISDLVRVLGNDHDVYTESVADFLHEIERSVIPDALKHFALCGRDPEEAFLAFDLVYNSHSPLPFSSRAFFDALFTAINTRLEQAVEDKVLYDAFKAQSGDLAARLDAIGACLRNATSIAPLTSPQYSELRVKIARGIESVNRQINVETTQGTRKVPIKKLFIAARLNALSDEGKIPAPHRESAQDRAQTINYLQFRRIFSNSVILGDPGGGKSTLTQLICYDLANQIVLESTTPKHRSFDSGDLRLPIRIILRTLEKRQ